MLNILCALLDAANIAYEQIAENEISIPTVALRALKEDACFVRTDVSLDDQDFVWIDDDVYVHIVEIGGAFSMAVMHNTVEGE